MQVEHALHRLGCLGHSGVGPQNGDVGSGAEQFLQRAGTRVGVQDQLPVACDGDDRARHDGFGLAGEQVDLADAAVRHVALEPLVYLRQQTAVPGPGDLVATGAVHA